MIGCRDLVVTAGGRELVGVPHLDVPAGTALAVLGRNGAGKSTLLRALAGLVRSSGAVLLDGEPAGRRELRVAVAAVLQRPVLRRGTVLANAATGLALRGSGRAAARDRALPWLDALGVAALAARDARTLSGGEAQRVALARALAVGPRVLLLDEPFTGLDATTRADLVADLRPLLAGTTTVLVTHDRAEAAALAGRTALLVDGRVRQEGATAHVLDHPVDLDCARLLGFTNVLPGRAVARPERTRLGDGPGVRLRGTVRRVVPLGPVVRLDLDTPHGPVAAITTDGVEVGREVDAHVPDGDVRTLQG